MKALLGGDWREGLLDDHRSPEEYRIQVLAWRNLERLDALYFVRPRSLRLLWNYTAEIGLRNVVRKVLSRSGERHRNEKYVSCGLGRILEAPSEARFPVGQAVAFLAPAHPACVERVVLPGGLLVPVPGTQMPALPEGVIAYQPVAQEAPPQDRWWLGLSGWSRYSGAPLSPEHTAKMQQRVLEDALQTDWREARILPVEATSTVTERTDPPPVNRTRLPSAALFGYGNYAKTIILPNVGPFLRLECIHEIDPTQIPVRPGPDRQWDSAPEARSDEHYDAYLIAGFHHTHASLAIHALEQGACAVVEKPIVVDEEQLGTLLKTMRSSEGRLFSCFHKRYLPLNRVAQQDLGLAPGDAISYHCIVYEVPLPQLHWYRWPNSRSRVVSNGCHWLDHFLYLNEFATVRTFNLFLAPDGTANVSVTLENGAFFTMVLTDHGGERVGVQDYIELRANGVTVKIINGSLYVAENRDRILRRRKIPKMESYRTMYRRIGQAVVDGTPGDSLRSVQVSCGLVLGLEQCYRERMSGTSDDLKTWARRPDTVREATVSRVGAAVR